MNQITKIELPDWVFSSSESQVSKQLRWSLRDIDELLNDKTITDIHINGNGTIFIKKFGQRLEVPHRLPKDNLLAIATNAAVLGRNRLTEAMPSSPGRFPDGQRGHVVRSPALPEGQVAMSIRRSSSICPTPQSLEDGGVFDTTVSADKAPVRVGMTELLELKQAGKHRQFIETAFRYGYNGVFAGMMNTGKTHNMKAFFHNVPLTRRIATVQDASELEDLPQRDIVHLLYPKDPGGVAQHTSENCVEWGLRMDFDEIVNGEVRDGAVWALMRAAATGHSIKTSCHAQSAQGAFQSLFLMAKQHPAAQSIDSDDLRQVLKELVDFVVFSEAGADGKRRITQVWFDPESKKSLPTRAAQILKETSDA